MNAENEVVIRLELGIYKNFLPAPILCHRQAAMLVQHGSHPLSLLPSSTPHSTVASCRS